MSDAKVSKVVQDIVDEARTMRDELKLKAHLGSMEVKEFLERFEPQADRLEAEVRKGTEAVESTFHQLLEEGRSWVDKLRNSDAK